MRSKSIWLGVFVALALVAAACGGETVDTTQAVATTQAPVTQPPVTEPPTTEPTGPVTVIIGTTDSISNLDSADAYAVHDWELIRNTGEGLMKFETGTANVVPGIAESFDVSDDGLTYTFHLRDGVTFYDGTPLTAEDYVVHIGRLLELEGSGGVGGALASPYIADVQAPDSSTVVFTLTAAFSYFPQVVTGAPYHPMHPSYPTGQLVEFPEAPWGGVGPWMVTELSTGEQTVLEPNPNYYGDAPLVDRIIIRYFTEASQLVQALQARDIDIAWRSVTEPGLLETLAGEENIVSAVVPGGGIRYFIMNHNIAPADDQKVRQAIASAIDRDEIIDRVFAGNAEALFSPIPPGFVGANEIYDDLYGSPDVAAATALFGEAGFTADNPLELEINYPPNRYGGVVADAMQVIKEQLEATGAVRVSLVATEWATYLGNVIQGESYSVSFLGWFFDYPDSSNYVEPFTLFGGLGTNVTDGDTGEVLPSLTTPELIDVIKEAATETDQAARAELYGQVQELYAQDVVTLPLWFEPERIFYWNDVAGDSDAENANTLNIGPTTDFNYNVLRFTG